MQQRNQHSFQRARKVRYYSFLLPFFFGSSEIKIFNPTRIRRLKLGTLVNYGFTVQIVVDAFVKVVLMCQLDKLDDIVLIEEKNVFLKLFLIKIRQLT